MHDAARSPDPFPRSRPGTDLVRRTALKAALLAAVPGLLMAGCGSSTPRKATNVTPVVRNIPAPLRGTVGTEVTFEGITPVLVSGYGLVVGLKGTGGQALPDRIAATMEREIGLKGVGKGSDLEGTPLEGKTPRQVLRDTNTAVVLVQAAIPPGAPLYATFDVYISALNATSIEGGRLYTTDLSIGDPTTFGGVQTRRIAAARGPVFINPFSEPGKEIEGVGATKGRILDGGIVTNPLKIRMMLDNASHTRARAIVSAINSRFPESDGDQGPAAVGVNDGNIAMAVPARYRERSGEFLDIVRHVQIDQSFPEEYARRYVQAIKNEPSMADDLSMCLVGLGDKAVPFVRDLYEFPEIRPRMAGLRAGALLGDARCADFLKRMAMTGTGIERTDAIALLGEVDAGPTIDMALRDLLTERELTVRVTAYESLARRAERADLRRRVMLEASKPVGEPTADLNHLQMLTRKQLPPGMLQGVEREMVPGKFVLDVVPVGDPLVYVTQQRLPRIVLFGTNTRLRNPLLVSAWSDRLMLTADVGESQPRLYYRDGRTQAVTTQEVSPDLRELVLFMAHEPTPESPMPGLNLTYSEVVGALYAINRAGGMTAMFTTERDRLRADLLKASRAAQERERPETAKDVPEVVIFEPTHEMEQEDQKAAKPAIVPITPPDPNKKK
ncbi:MAG: flagellar basal body P-ring protein FlgI [Phycisphaerales bacterium]|nr:flagellar basal body P-ring protein FlgI [Phycisphaerales bacterium]